MSGMVTHNMCTLYAWPYKPTNPIIQPEYHMCDAATGRFYAVYKSSNCPELFLVPLKSPYPEKIDCKKVPDAETNLFVSENADADFDPVYSSHDAENIPPPSQEHPRENPMAKITITIKEEIEKDSGMNSEHPIVSRKRRRIRWCTFCKSNGERERLYRSHRLKSTTLQVTCPVLRKFVCAVCQATGDNAHTAKYCPLRSQQEQSRDLTYFPKLVTSATGRVKICRY